jgi:hypothetical protein
MRPSGSSVAVCAARAVDMAGAGIRLPCELLLVASSAEAILSRGLAQAPAQLNAKPAPTITIMSDFIGSSLLWWASLTTVQYTN